MEDYPLPFLILNYAESTSPITPVIDNKIYIANPLCLTSLSLPDIKMGNSNTKPINSSQKSVVLGFL